MSDNLFELLRAGFSGDRSATAIETGDGRLYSYGELELASGRIGTHERAVLFNCATGLKYPMPDAGVAIDLAGAIDYGAMRGDTRG